ncbi:MAG: hypothetical protein M3Y08_15335 [Fibrobacterota bacterium]|nr:hypothetical protein [Fibrobacterota bacterium]
MKKISTSSSLPSPRFQFRLGRVALLAVALLLASCAFTDYGNRINQEQLEIARLEDKRHNLETQYIIVLNNLEIHPAEDKLIKERDEVRRKLIDLSTLVNERRKLLDQSINEWNQKIVSDRIEREMVDREIKDNEGKNEDVEFENK